VKAHGKTFIVIIVQTGLTMSKQAIDAEKATARTKGHRVP